MQNQEEQNRKAVLLCLQTPFEGWNGTARAVLCRSMSPTGRRPGSHFSAVLPRNPTVSTAGVELDSLNLQADRAVFLVSRSARLHTQTGQGPGPGRSSDVPSLGSVSCRRQHRAQGTGTGTACRTEGCSQLSAGAPAPRPGFLRSSPVFILTSPQLQLRPPVTLSSPSPLRRHRPSPARECRVDS